MFREIYPAIAVSALCSNYKIYMLIQSNSRITFLNPFFVACEFGSCSKTLYILKVTFVLEHFLIHIAV